MKSNWILLAALLLTAGLVLAAGQEGTWTGVITDTHCGYKANHTAACVNVCVTDKGAKYALANPDNGKLYIIQPQDKAAPLANEKVKVTGTLEGDTIQVKTIEKVAK
ncbi:MAG TPA: hypothetical protein VEG63_09610 [Candidatus Acidoferrales bacterium]|nr:hypothetical protein [Candidatus Acidoferrales bacterium]